jgi:hypothetical protein
MSQVTRGTPYRTSGGLQTDVVGGSEDLDHVISTEESLVVSTSR